MIESIEVAEFRFKAVGRSEVNDVTSDSRNELHVVVRLHEDLLNLVFPEGIVFDVSAKCEESGLCEAFVNLPGGDDKVSHVALRLHGVPVGVNIVVLSVVGEDSHHRQALFNEDVENSVR